MRSLKVFLVSCLMFTFMLSSVAFGASTPQESLKEVEIAETVQFGTTKVNVYEDGRVGKILKPSSLTKAQKQEILNIMNFSDEEINRFSDQFINELLMDGGVRVDVVVEDYIHTYTDASGVEKTVSVVEKVDGRDFSISSDGSGPIEDGKFYGNGILTYVGTDSTNYKYKYRTYFSFDTKPNYTYTDTVAHAWQQGTTSTSVTGKYHYRRGPNSGWLPGNKVELDVSTGYGTSGSVDLINNTGFHEGWIEDSVSIPKKLVGEKGQFASSYAHQHTPTWLDGVGINIAGWLTINFKGTFGDKWSWRNTFTIGGTKLE